VYWWKIEKKLPEGYIICKIKMILNLILKMTEKISTQPTLFNEMFPDVIDMSEAGRNQLLEVWKVCDLTRQVVYHLTRQIPDVYDSDVLRLDKEGRQGLVNCAIASRRLSKSQKDLLEAVVDKTIYDTLVEVGKVHLYYR